MGEVTQSQSIVLHSAVVGGNELLLEETADFPYDDPWSTLTRRVVSELREDGQLDGRDFLEAGLGDGRNALLALDMGEGGASRLTGIELDDWRLAAAARNLTAAGVDPDRIDLHQTDIVEWLQSGDHFIRGLSLACLPQAPRAATENDADGYQDLDSLGPFHDVEIEGHTVDEYGLTLNAAYLGALRRRVIPDGDSTALVTLSDRVPRTVLERLFDKTGWKISDVYQAEDPVQQDPDTGVGWIIRFDDGERFQKKDAEGQFVPISAMEAETRRRESLAYGGAEARDLLNVYHGLSVYHLHPRQG